MDEDVASDARIGVVGNDVDAVVAAVTNAGASATAVETDGERATAESVADVVAESPDAFVAVGEPALLALARTVPDAPVLAIDAGRGVRSVPDAAVASAVERLLAGDWATDRHPIVAVAVGDERVGRAVTDLTLVTERAAHISEYTISHADDRVAQIRADGVVIATPAGSPNYARAAGGPVIAPGTDVGVAVPIAPFVTDPDHWVLPLSDIRVGVDRDTAGVELLLDDRSCASVEPGRPVTTAVAGHVETVVLPEGTSPYGRR
ncbi:MAG: ATP-NAD kinase [Haloarculaceae archaeon]